MASPDPPDPYHDLDSDQRNRLALIGLGSILALILTAIIAKAFLGILGTILVTAPSILAVIALMNFTAWGALEHELDEHNEEH
jgi:hypothetical protein